MRDFRLSDDLHDPAFEFGGRAFGGVPQPVAVGVDRIYGDMQELGDFAVARDAQPDHGQQPEFGVEAGHFHLLPVPQQGIGLFHEIGIKRKEYPVEFVEERFVFLLDGRRRAQLTQKALLSERERCFVEVCAVAF